MMTVYFSCLRQHKHQGNVYCYMFCQFNTAVDTSLKPLLSKKIRALCCRTSKCPDVSKTGPAAICNQSLGEKEK